MATTRKPTATVLGSALLSAEKEAEKVVLAELGDTQWKAAAELVMKLYTKKLNEVMLNGIEGASDGGGGTSGGTAS